jgi:uncharacterized membrane protein YfcA
VAIDLTTTEIVLVVAAVFGGALVKSVTGMGFPLVAIPIMTLFLPTPTAVAVIAVPNAIQNVILAVGHRGARAGTRHLIAFCSTGIVGAVIGAFALGTVDEVYLRLALTLMLGAYLVTVVATPDLEIPERRIATWTPPVGFVAGLFQGAIGISGPVVGTWHHGLRLTREAFVMSVATVFALTGTTQATVLGIRGELDGRLLVALGLTAVMLLTLPLGTRLRRSLSVEHFRNTVLVLLTLSWFTLVADLVGRAV